MGFFEWLFGKSKKDELVEETRVLQFDNNNQILKKYDETNSNNVLSALLQKSIDNGYLKNYNGIADFIKKYPKSTEVIGDNWDIHLYPTKPIRQLWRKWNVLKYKCTDSNLLSILGRIKMD